MLSSSQKCQSVPASVTAMAVLGVVEYMQLSLLLRTEVVCHPQAKADLLKLARFSEPEERQQFQNCLTFTLRSLQEVVK